MSCIITSFLFLFHRNMQTMQDSANYINTLQKTHSVSGEERNCTVGRAHRDAAHSNEQHVPNREDVLCSASSSLSSSHNAEFVKLDNNTNPRLHNPTLYSNESASATHIVRAEHPDPKHDSLFQPPTPPATTEIEPDGIQCMVTNALDVQQQQKQQQQQQQKTPNTLDATVPYNDVSPISAPTSTPTHTHQEQHPRLDDAEHCQFLRAILEIVSRAVKCTRCQSTYNASVLCSNYTIKLNRLLQCACGCVICSVCYTNDNGCCVHKLQSRRATTNVVANQLANAVDMKWDLELDKKADFRTECDYSVQSLIHLDRSVPTADELKQGKREALVEKHKTCIVINNVPQCVTMILILYLSAFHWLMDSETRLLSSTGSAHLCRSSSRTNTCAFLTLRDFGITSSWVAAWLTQKS